MPTLVEFDEAEEDQRHSNTVGANAGAVTQIQRLQNRSNGATSRQRLEESGHNADSSDDSSEGSSDDSNMGISSRNANGSIKKMKKKGATRAKFKLNTLRDTLRGAHYYVSSHITFIPAVHCQLCKRRAISKALADGYHHGHNPKCPNKPSNRKRLQKKGISITPWQRAAASSVRHQPAAPNNNNGGSELTEVASQRTNRQLQNAMPPTSIAYSKASYTRMGTLRLLPSLMPNWLLPEMQTTGESPPIDFAVLMKCAIDKIMDRLDDPNCDFAWAKNSKAPAPIACAVDLILQQFTGRRKKSPDGILQFTDDFQERIKRYYEFFPMKSCCFKFPTDLGANPSPHYHQIEGQSIIYLDWQLAFPNTRLPCPHCSAGLVHDRTNFGKNKGTLFPIWNIDGSVTWCVTMVYKCQSCNCNVDANDGRLLHRLPEHMRSIYPVPPKYAKNGGFDVSSDESIRNGGFHLHKDVIQVMESVFKTYGNGDMLSTHMLQSLGRNFIHKVSTYLSKEPNKAFVSFVDFVNDFWPPSGKTLRRLWESAEYSPLQPYGYSNYERNCRECQAVTAKEGEMVAYDHTFQATHAYQNKENLHCFFTGVVSGTKEISLVLGVPTTKLADAAHGLIQSAKKRGMKPSVVSTDTVPHGIDFWKALYGDDIHCQLGLFHLMQRLVEELDPESDLFWECLLELKECIYRYNPILYEALVNALLEGKLSKDGKKYTLDEIEAMRHSKTFTSRYDKYLTKQFHTKQQIITNLERWISRWDGRCDDRGRYVFNDKTVEKTRNQFQNVEFVLDCEGAVVYTEVKAPANSKHGLSEWRSNRPESALEKFHELLAHFCNYGCKDEFANALLQRGWAEYNVVARHRHECMKKRSAGQSLPHPKGLDKTPVFLDHSLLHHINQLSESLRLGTVFPDCKVPPLVNNGEKFLKEYLIEQLRRFANGEFDSSTKRCTCNLCTDLFSDNPDVGDLLGEEEQICQVIGQDGDEGTNEEPTAAMTSPRSPESSPYASHPKFKPCFSVAPFLCSDMQEYWRKKASGVSVRGRPPHSYNCPSNSMFNGVAPQF